MVQASKAFTKLVIDWSGIGPISRTSLHIGQVQQGTLRERRLEGNCITRGCGGCNGRCEAKEGWVALIRVMVVTMLRMMIMTVMRLMTIMRRRLVMSLMRRRVVVMMMILRMKRNRRGDKAGMGW